MFGIRINTVASVYRSPTYRDPWRRIRYRLGK